MAGHCGLLGGFAAIIERFVPGVKCKCCVGLRYATPGERGMTKKKVGAIKLVVDKGKICYIIGRSKIKKGLGL
jgi:hypothetical protein